MKPVIFLLIGLLAFASGAMAAPLVATVDQLSGQVLRLIDDHESPLRKGDALNLGEGVRTGPDGSVLLRFQDGSTVELSSDSAVELDESMVSTEEESGFSLNQLFGTLIAFVKSLRGDDLVVTPTMSLGIRGTRFMVTVADDGVSAVSVQKGVVATTSKTISSTGGSSVLTQGQEVVAHTPGQQLTPRPARITTQADAEAFRQEQLQSLLPILPEKIAELNAALDDTLVRMRRLQKGILRELERLKPDRIRAQQLLGPKRAKEVRQRLRQESQHVRLQLRGYKLGALRCKGMFRRAKRYMELMPLYQKRAPTLGGELEMRLSALWQKRMEVREEIKAMGMELREAWRPFKALRKHPKKPGKRN